MKYFIHLPMKMEPIVSSETSAIKSQTPGNYPKRNKLRNCSSLDKRLSVSLTLSGRWTKGKFAGNRFGPSVSP